MVKHFIDDFVGALSAPASALAFVKNRSDLGPLSYYSFFAWKRVWIAPFLALRSDESTLKTELKEYADKTELNENGAKQKRISVMWTSQTEEFEYANDKKPC